MGAVLLRSERDAVGPVRVVHVSSELAPYSGTGGLADVSAALPDALAVARPGATVAVFSPLYRVVAERAPGALRPCGVEIGGARLFTLPAQPGSARRYFLSHPLFDRDGVYDDPRGWPHGDNPERFATLCRVALEAAPHVLGGAPDVVHAHDWPAALALHLMRRDYRDAYERARAVLTVHNIGYPGAFDKSWVELLGLSWRDFTLDGFEFHDQLSLLKAGLAAADVIVAPSPSHAREIRTPEGGHGLDGFLRARAAHVVGVLNGIDTAAWDPRHDPHLPAVFAPEDLQGKSVCRATLAEEFGLDVGPDTPLLGVVARFAWQKGLDLLADIAPALLADRWRLAVVGTGDPALEERWIALAERHPGRVATRITFDPALAHLVFAGADAHALLSRYEPCGLTQLYAMRYGTIPIVRAVGGLADTVSDPGSSSAAPTGFRFGAFDAPSALEAFARAAACFRGDTPLWRRLQQNGMAFDASWARSAATYWRLYELHESTEHPGR